MAVKKNEFKPTPNDEGWHDYVMSLFHADELDNGKPKCDGLRRLTELLIGKIVTVAPRVVVSEKNYACVEILIEIIMDLDKTKDIYHLSIGDVADCHLGNTPAEYALHASATAMTRAESRVYRKLLRLRNVISAEEQNDKLNEKYAEETAQNKINDGMITIIRNICKRCRIDVSKFINNGSKLYSDIKEVDHDVAVAMIYRLDQYQRNFDGIPENIKISEK